MLFSKFSRVVLVWGSIVLVVSCVAKAVFWDDVEFGVVNGLIVVGLAVGFGLALAGAVLAYRSGELLGGGKN